MDLNLSVTQSSSGATKRLQWRNPLPRDAKKAWGIMGSIVAVIWVFLVPSLINESGAPRLFLICFSVPMAAATITLLLLATRATFGDRTESITFEADTLTYSRAPACSYLFFGDGLRENDRMSRFTGSFSGGIAAAFSRRESMTIDRKDVANVVCDHHCQIFISDGHLFVGLNLPAEDIATIGDAIKTWKASDNCIRSMPT